jgi:hypothetical protein
MLPLQASWTHNRTVFFWTADGTPAEPHIELAFPSIDPDSLSASRRYLSDPAQPDKRKRVMGVEAPIGSVLTAFAALEPTEPVSPSIGTFSLATKLGLELATQQRVVPSVEGSTTGWRALLTRRHDLDRFHAISHALPPASRAIPLREMGRSAIRLKPAETTVREFMDAVVDSVYRQGAYPGSAKGWVREFADALRSEDDVAFAPRDARYQGMAPLLAAWATGEHVRGARLGFDLVLPATPRSKFSLRLWLHNPDGAGRVRLSNAWRAGAVRFGHAPALHPAHPTICGLARASRIFSPITACLAGAAPRELKWSARQAWDFLDRGARDLREAGFAVNVPEEFAREGCRRIRARIRFTAPKGTVELRDSLPFHWEVTLGDLILTGSDFAEVLKHRQPVVPFRGDWVLLDPAELSRLPDGLPRSGTLPVATALRAILVGELDGVPVTVDDALQAMLDELDTPPEVEISSDLLCELRPYQERGVRWLAALGRFALGAALADDMGLGKTPQLIAHILGRRARATGPCLVVCPTSVLGNWQRELARFAPTLRVRRYHGPQRTLAALDQVDILLTTYGLMVRDHAPLGDVRWDVLALDEAQAIKNPSSQRARSARSLNAAQRVVLTGTPVENRLTELWSLMDFILPGFLGPAATFRRTVAVPIERFGDAAMAERLKTSIAPFLLRRLKTDPTIITDLPDKIEIDEFVQLTTEQADLYRDVSRDYLERIGDASDIERRGHVLAMLTALKQVCNHPSQFLKEQGEPLEGRSGKLERMRELVDTILESGEHALVFTQYRQMGIRLQQHLREELGIAPPFLHGGTAPAQRDELVRAFQEDADVCPILIISLHAGGTGLNLTRATHVIHFDRWWNPAVEDQASDRAYRIGQRKNVVVHRLVCQDTLEERIAHMLTVKRALAESVVSTGDSWITELDDSALARLVQLGTDAVLEDE